MKIAVELFLCKGKILWDSILSGWDLKKDYLHKFCKLTFIKFGIDFTMQNKVISNLKYFKTLENLLKKYILVYFSTTNECAYLNHRLYESNVFL